MKEKILSISFVFILTCIMFLSFIMPDEDVSSLERRKLSLAPEFTFSKLFDGGYFEDLNVYLNDQFPARVLLRKLKGIVSSNVFYKNLDGDTFIQDEELYQLNTTLNEKSVEHFATLVNSVIKNNNISKNVYYSVIPDKSYYLNNIPKMDYDKFNSLLNKYLDIEYIDIYAALNRNSYYKTDIHWRQEYLADVLSVLAEKMDFETTKFSYLHKEKNFYGALYGKIANNLSPENIIYLDSSYIKNAIVYDYEKSKYRTVYDNDDLKNVDMHDIFLGGAKSLLVIENDECESKRELILFRDSFGSSLAPLLMHAYSKITLVDLRYITSSYLKENEFLSFNKNTDVLFLYSVPLINNSFTLK